MRWLNYHHLYYFWIVAREGSISAAASKLRLAPSTISAQIRALEEHFERPLFDRSGRRLELTDAGRVALHYADQIYALGRDLDEALLGALEGRPVRLRVGISDLVPKLVAHRLVDPALDLAGRVQLHVVQDRPERLVADLALHHLDVVIADQPLGLRVDAAVTSHPLGGSGITLYGTEELAARYRPRFPDSLAGAPMLLPAADTHARRQLEGWLEARGLVPDVVADVGDSGLLKAFGGAGRGLFAAPSLVREEVERVYGAVPVGELEGLHEQYYAMTAPHRSDHPGVQAMLHSAAEALGPLTR